jgi:hypothetical protein
LACHGFDLIIFGTNSALLSYSHKVFLSRIRNPQLNIRHRIKNKLIKLAFPIYTVKKHDFLHKTAKVFISFSPLKSPHHFNDWLS